MYHDTIRRKIGEARVSRPPMRDPDFVCDLFARLLEERLRSSLGGPIAVQVESAKLARLSAALEAAGETALYAVAETRDEHLGGVLTLNAALMHRVIEVMTGAPAGSIPPGRRPTAIDEALIANLVEDVIYTFEQAVTPGPRPAGGLAINFARFTRKPNSLAEAPEFLDTFAFQLTLSTGDEPIPMTFIVPLGVLDIYRAEEKKAASQRPPIGEAIASDMIWSSTMRAAAQMAEFRLIGVLQEMSLTVDEIAGLAPGSVIPLPDSTHMEVGLRLDSPKGVAGAPDIAFGPLGSSAGHRAVKVVLPPDEELVNRLAPFIAKP